MSDISIVWSPELSRGDWVLVGTQLQSGSDLVTAILLSLFTDRVVGPDDVIPDGTSDPRGWWGDDQAHPVGSRLWLLSRAKQTNETLARAKEYIAEALQWLIDDGVVAKFGITVEWTRAGLLGAQVRAYRDDGITHAVNFASAWTPDARLQSAQGAYVASGPASISYSQLDNTFVLDRSTLA
jgi:phage gp46-like protein